MQVIESILADATQIAALRRDIHAHPELCFEEKRTSDLIAKQLTDWGIPIHRGLGTTGIVAILKSGTSDRAVGLRADIDALPITEHNQFPHKSTAPGKMHACGHDGHTAMLLAAAKHLSKHRNYDGTVYLIFQPAEEGGGGAREMIKDGIFEKFPMEAVFGAHNWPGMKAGQFALHRRFLVAPGIGHVRQKGIDARRLVGLLHDIRDRGTGRDFNARCAENSARGGAPQDWGFCRCSIWIGGPVREFVQ